MSWIKHFVKVPTAQKADRTSGSTGSSSKLTSILPEVYAGHPNRIQRYSQYAEMDRDTIIRQALDTIADFCTQSEEQNDSPFNLKYYSEANETEVKLLDAALGKWVRLNKFRSKLWHIFRNTIMNGDAFFLRDPETGEWLWVDHFSVERVTVDEENGKEPDEYIIRGLDLNKQAKFATFAADPLRYGTTLGGSNSLGRPVGQSSASSSTFNIAGADSGGQKTGQQIQDQLFVVDAKHVVHLSLSQGMDVNWPFGESTLDAVFKPYKQMSLLEDAIIIYRIQRAPERRVFYIDTGDMPQNKAKAHLEAVKNEVHQRRIPGKSGMGGSTLDASYSPLSLNDDYFLSVGMNGRGSKIETLPGGELVGQIGDLLYFANKLLAGLKIPPIYRFDQNTDGGGGSAAYNDGKIGVAMVQEFLFSKYCMRLQGLLGDTFDYEFKYYLRKTGIEIDENMFELQFSPPQNFAKYRQIEVDTAQMQVYSQIKDDPTFSKRFLQKRFLNMSDDEIIDNERMWKEENPKKVKSATGGDMPADDQAGLGAVGLRSGAMFPDTGSEMEMGGDEFAPEGGEEGGADAGAGAAGGGDVAPSAPQTGGAAPEA